MKKIRIAIAKIYNYLIYKDQIQALNELSFHRNSTDEEHKKHQLKKLSNILIKAKSNIPYYKENLEDIDVLDYNSFQRIPFLTKPLIRQNLNGLQSSDPERFKKIYKNSSGGSTGEPVTFYQTEEYSNRARASAYFANLLNGVTPYDKKIVFWGAVRDMHHPEKRSLIRRLKDYIGNQRMLNTFVMDNNIMQKYIDILNDYKPTFIKAYVHSIYELAKFINKNNIKISFTPVIQTTTGPLYPEMRSEIKKAFNNCHVFNYYGSREVSSIASEVKGKDGLQVMYDNIFVEILDENGKQVKKGEEGEIVVTTLNNEYMPLIRFKIGDRGVKGDDEEFGTLVINSVLGRTLGVIYREDGSYIDGQYFVTLFFNNTGIERFQLVQNNLKTLELKIVKSPTFNQNSLDEIVMKIKQELPDVKVNINYVNSIDPASTGKIMYVYSELTK